MTPICLPYRRTESAVSFFGSNFISRLLRSTFVAMSCIQRPFLYFTGLLVQVVADERLYDGDQGAGNHEEIVVEHAYDLKQRVVARHDFAGLDARDVPLADAKTAGQIPLAPAALLAGLDEGAAHRVGQCMPPQRRDTLFCLFRHYRCNIAHQYI